MAAKKAVALLKQTEGRGRLLTVLLVLHSLWVLTGTPDVISPLLFRLQSVDWIGIVRSLFSFVILLGLWKWKKIAVYAFFLLEGLFPLIAILILFERQYWGYIALFPLLYFSIWFWAFKQRWHLFT